MNSDLDRLEEKIQKARYKEPESTHEKSEAAENLSMGIRAGTELIGSIGAGGFIGWLLDNWLGSHPLFLIIMLVLGIITGFYNVYRVSQNRPQKSSGSELHPEDTTAKNAAEKENVTE